MKAGFETLNCEDGFSCPAWIARPDAPPRAGVIVLQEIFGLTAHITGVADRLARAGYLAIAPDLFARTGLSRPIAYTDPEAGLAAVAQTDAATRDRDFDAALAEMGHLSTGVIGFCWGGGEAWRLAARRSLPATVCFYPTRMDAHVSAPPQGGVQVHVAQGDRHTPDALLERLKASQADVELFSYDAAHGFMCELRAGHDADAAALAWTRVLSHLERGLTGPERPEALNGED